MKYYLGIDYYKGTYVIYDGSSHVLFNVLTRYFNEFLEPGERLYSCPKDTKIIKENSHFSGEIWPVNEWEKFDDGYMTFDLWNPNLKLDIMCLDRHVFLPPPYIYAISKSQPDFMFK